MTLIKRKIDNLYYPELSYEISGLLFKTHNELGRFKLEKQYCDLFEKYLIKNKIKFQREKDLRKIFIEIDSKGNIPDFIIEEKIIVDFKNKKFITKEDYYQMIRYLDVSNFKLGMIVNFRSTYLKPKRVVNSKFNSRH
ncbi:MAG TPA: GxxExxY protein [Candidatus Moranbacteria bacterium]|jgi:GxxExxY protein|nr:GxxExxY protein [Candidatus Moranbacteria bacterium]HRY27891.1 GxxExxY protein [Candidatus Moranbacteria bacterium]HSA08362.1 GxxExxY protein [Candidatus Moranbacteria bacterium]